MQLQNLTNNNKVLYSLIFAFFFLIYVATSGGHTDVYDGVATFLIAENLALTGSPSINMITNEQSAIDLGFDLNAYTIMKAKILAQGKYIRGDYGTLDSTDYTVHDFFEDNRSVERYTVDGENFFGPAYLPLPIIASVFYSISLFLNVPPINFVSLFSNSIILSFSSLMMFLIGKKFFSSYKIGFVVSIMFGLSSFIWPYITSLHSRPLAILFFLVMIYCIISYKDNKKLIIPLFAGISFGLCFISHHFFIFLVPGLLIFSIYRFKDNKKPLAIFLLVTILMMGLWMTMNYLRFDDPLNFGIGGQASDAGLWINYHGWTRTLEGLYGLLLSPGNSLFLYYPLAILFPFGLYYLYKKDKSLTILFLYISAVPYIFVGTNPEWYTSNDWGPHRYLLTMIPIIALSIGAFIVQFSSSLKMKIGIISLIFTGIIINLIGNLVWTMYAFSYGWGPEGLWKNPDNSLVFTWNPYFSPIIQSLKVLSTDWIGRLDPNPDTLNYFKIGLTGCTYDLFLYCEYGITSLIIIGLILIFVSYMIYQFMTKQKINNF